VHRLALVLLVLIVLDPNELSAQVLVSKIQRSDRVFQQAGQLVESRFEEPLRAGSPAELRGIRNLSGCRGELRTHVSHRRLGRVQGRLVQTITSFDGISLATIVRSWA